MIGERLSQYARSESQPGSGLCGLRYLVVEGGHNLILAATVQPRRPLCADTAEGTFNQLRDLESSSEVECAPIRYVMAW